MDVSGMREIKSRLAFDGSGTGSVYFYAQCASAIGFSSERALEVALISQSGEMIEECTCDGMSFVLPSQGNYRLAFLPDAKGRGEITLYCGDGVLPYLMPGVGVLWEHGAVYPLLLAKNQSHTLWVISSAEDKSDAAAVIKGIDYGRDVSVSMDGEPFAADWYPKMERPWFWHSACIGVARIMSFTLPMTASDVRFTVYGRVVAALCEPFVMPPFGKLRVRVCDGDGGDSDARVEVFVDSERVALEDRLSGEDTVIYLPYGRYRVRASHGMFYSVDEALAEVSSDSAELTLTVREAIKLPHGWIPGELHTHSALEDATLFPRQVMRAARSCGRGFCYMTDKRVELLGDFGLHEADREGVFAGFPGQEIMCHELHTNLLNPSHTVENPEAEELSRTNRDIESKVEGWLAEYRRMKEHRPCLIMHNHPEHRAEVMKRGQPYFRSWWVTDMFGEDYHLVENCGFEGWFDRLDRGRRLYAAWTGDGHDCTLMYPGMEGVCVYTGGELSERAVTDALEQGRFFSCRAPGAFIDIERTERGVRVTVSASLPVDVVEIVADSRVIASFSGEGSCIAEVCADIPDGTLWAMARTKLRGGDWDRTRYSFTPFMESGYTAFTNPLFFT